MFFRLWHNFYPNYQDALLSNWLMNNTGNSVLMAVLLHGCYNLVSVSYLPITTVAPAYGIFTFLAWIVALELIRRYGAQRLVRAGGTRRLAILPSRV